MTHHATLVENALHRFIADHGRPPTTRELAEVTGLSPVAASEAVKVLEDDGRVAVRRPRPVLRLVPNGEENQ